ncbi:MAG: hypothetical protein WC919_01180 [Candidatus Paceibacterota bacterium]
MSRLVMLRPVLTLRNTTTRYPTTQELFIHLANLIPGQDLPFPDSTSLVLTALDMTTQDEQNGPRIS